jgi:SAM-dependent methyltransferase
MELPDASRLLTPSPEQWRALGLRLDEIGIQSCAHSVGEVGTQLLAPMQAAARKWHLRRLAGAAPDAARMLMFNDPVSATEAALALGEALLGTLVACGLIVRLADGRVVSPFLLRIANRRYLVCDDLLLGGDAVMGAGATTVVLCQAAHPNRVIQRALDLGCGAGTFSLLIAECTERVVGTDINPRAIILSRLNAAINGIHNVEFRLGDGFAPVANETFDLIATQPPFVARPEGIPASAYLYGGPRGDELPLRLLSEVPCHLSPGGRAVVLCDWPVTDDTPIEERVRGALAAYDLDLLTLSSSPMDLDYHCAMYATLEWPNLNADFERRLGLWREHLDRMQIRELRPCLHVIQRGSGNRGWTATVDRPVNESTTSAQIDLWMAVHDLLDEGPEALLAATLRVPEGAVFAKEYELKMPGEAKFVARLGGQQPINLSDGALFVVSLLDEEPTVAAAVERFAAQQSLSVAEAAEQMLPGVEQALRMGILAPVTSGSTSRHAPKVFPTD